MCYVAPESMTRSEDEEETRLVFRLPNSTIVVIGVDGDYNDFWYRWSLASSSGRIGLTNQMP